MWSDPPTFVEDGTPLSAASLNILSDNAAWLYNQVRRVVPAMPVYRVPWTLDAQYLEQVQAQYRIRHVGRYLRVRIHGTTTVPVRNGDGPRWSLSYDGVVILTDQWPDNVPTPITRDYTVDLQAVLPGLVIGTRYQIAVSHEEVGNHPGSFELTYAYETETVE